MLCLVVVFGVHSLVDWTWYVPGNACVALLCAGWLAGRGPLRRRRAARAPPRPPRRAAARRRGCDARCDAALAGARRRRASARVASRRDRRRRAARGVGAVAAAALGDASQQALGAARRATRARRWPRRRAPCRATRCRSQALFTLAAVQQAARRTALARATLQRAVRLQPSNPQTWLTLGAVRPARATRARPCASWTRRSTSNPESVAPEAIAAGNPEAIAIAERLHAGAARGERAASRGESADAGVARRRARSARRAATRQAARGAERRRQAHGGGHAPHRRGPKRRRQPAQKRERSADASSTRRAPGSPPAPRTSICSKPKSSSSARERAPRVEAQVVGARVEVRVERAAPTAPARAASARPCAGVLSSSAAARAQHAAHLRQPAAVSATCSIVSPAQTASKLASASGHSPSASTSRTSSRGDARARAAQRLLGDVDADAPRSPRARARPSS